MQAPEITILLDIAQKAAFEGGRSTLGFYQRSQLDIETKADTSPVTAADKQAEKVILQIIKTHFPDHPVIAEESGEQTGSGKYRWIIDPIDGTKSFITGIPFYGTTIGIEDVERDEVIIGILYFPALNDMIWAVKGQGTYWNGRRVSVSKKSQLSQSLLLATDIQHMEPAGLDRMFQQLLKQVKLFRTWGDCYGHFLVATGRADIMIDPQMKIWDSAPLKPIIEEAGGIFCDRYGEPSIRSESVLTGSPELIKQVLEILQRNST